MEIAKDRVLHGVCNVIADTRATINEANAMEKKQKAKALQRMIDAGITTYTANGIQLVHTSTDMLSVKVVQDDKAEAVEVAPRKASREQGDLGETERVPVDEGEEEAGGDADTVN